MDNWDRKTNFNCESCRYYVPKKAYGDNQGACRRNAPTLKGFPVVYGNADWCGEHKIGSNPVRDGKEGYEPPMGQADNKPLTKEEILQNCERCGVGPICPPIYRRACDKVKADEPLDSPAFESATTTNITTDDHKIHLKAEEAFKKEAEEIERVNNLHREAIAEEKAKIKARISDLIMDIVAKGNGSGVTVYIPKRTQEIRELLEKL